MGLYQSILGTLENRFRVGNAASPSPYIGLFNGFLTKLIATPTANRDILLPDKSGTLAIASPIQTVTLNLVYQTQTFEASISSPGTLATNSIMAWFAPTVDYDDNDLWQLEGCTIYAECDTDQVFFFFSSPYMESDNIKINYQII
jgi:hypothetical protein